MECPHKTWKPVCVCVHVMTLLRSSRGKRSNIEIVAKLQNDGGSKKQHKLPMKVIYYTRWKNPYNYKIYLQKYKSLKKQPICTNI